MELRASGAKIGVGLVLCLGVAAGAVVLVALAAPDAGVLSRVPEFVVTAAEVGLLGLALAGAAGLVRAGLAMRRGELFVWTDRGAVQVRSLFGRLRHIPVSEIRGVELSFGQGHAPILPMVLIVTGDGWVAVPPILEQSTRRVRQDLLQFVGDVGGGRT